MVVSIAHLGPPGTNAETAAIAYANWLAATTGQAPLLCPYPSIAQTLKAVAQGETQLAVVPVENSIEGSVTVTLDSLWQLGNVQIQQALVLPIVHALISQAKSLDSIQTVYSHPQALSQCQEWLDQHLPNAQLIPSNSTTEALNSLDQDSSIAAIAAPRAAELYRQPILVHPINDYPDNCTRFWVVSLTPSTQGTHTSLGLSTAANIPGALVKLLQVFAERGINLSRIESRPTKRSLGDYLFFMDLEADLHDALLQSALVELESYTETLKIFGSYSLLKIESPSP